ncbi:MAG: helix-turn-helix transcriptional regulator [Patescibacteria group bacterium]|nr:helix-turn-helix transcriptional regulator [Patescibacteria group bacterium]
MTKQTETTTKPLKDWHKKILSHLDKDRGFTSQNIGSKVWPKMGRRTASQSARMHLEELERRGLVKRLDSGKPIAWVLI